MRMLTVIEGLVIRQITIVIALEGRTRLRQARRTVEAGLEVGRVAWLGGCAEGSDSNGAIPSTHA
jgi:hypothetical protein